MADSWKTKAITRHLPAADTIDMGLMCWKREDRRSTLKCRMTQNWKTDPKISWTLWLDWTKAEDTQPNMRVVYYKRQDSPTTEAEADFIGKALLAWLEGASEADLLATLPPSDPFPF